MAWLRGFVLFGLLVAAPLLLEQLFGSHPMGHHINVSNSFRENVLSYSGFGLLILLLVGFLIALIAYLPRTIQISEWLTLAERDMNSLLRGWGGGLAADTRRGMAKERAEWLTMLPIRTDALSDLYKDFFNINQKELAGGSQGDNMSKARHTAFLLRELYEGNVKNAQLKIFNEIANGSKPYIASGIRQIVGYDRFDEKNGFPKDAGADWFSLWLAVKLNRYPRDIIMVRQDKTVARNWTVIDELNNQLDPERAGR